VQGSQFPSVTRCPKKTKPAGKSLNEMMGLMGKSTVHDKNTMVREVGLQLDQLGFMVILAVVLMGNPR